MNIVEAVEKQEKDLMEMLPHLDNHSFIAIYEEHYMKVSNKESRVSLDSELMRRLFRMGLSIVEKK